MTPSRTSHIVGTLAFVCFGLASNLLAQSSKSDSPADGTEQVGYYPTLQTSSTSMRYLPGWEPTLGLSPTSPAYGPGAPQQSRFSRGFDRFLDPLVPNEATWNSPARSGHFAGNYSGETFVSEAGVTSVRANSGLWLDRDFDPRMAEIKAGPLYLDFNFLEAIALWSDVNGPFADRLPDDGFIAMFGLNLSAFIQITSQTYLKAMGTLYYVPTENEVGFFFGSGGATYVQLEHRFSLGGWDIHLYDQFDVFHPLAYLLADLSRRTIDQSGLYRAGYQKAFVSSPWSLDNVFFRNICGLEATTYLGHDFRFRMGYEHWETWQADDLDRLTPLDHLSAGLFYENNVFWFRPWLIYDGYFTSQFTDSFQQVAIGANLPINRSLLGFARAGYAWWDGGVYGEDNANFVWDVGLTHTINSTWAQSVGTGYSYQLGPLPDDNSFGYYAHYLLRFAPPRGRISVNGLIQWQRQEWGSSDSWLVGAQAQYIIDPKSTFDAYAYYWASEAPANADSSAWLYRMQLSRNLSTSLVGRLAYQFTDFRAGIDASDFTDHMLMLSLTKFF